jgi:hypothetical protein
VRFGYLPRSHLTSFASLDPLFEEQGQVLDLCVPRWFDVCTRDNQSSHARVSRFEFAEYFARVVNSKRDQDGT